MGMIWTQRGRDAGGGQVLAESPEYVRSRLVNAISYRKSLYDSVALHNCALIDVSSRQTPCRKFQIKSS